MSKINSNSLLSIFAILVSFSALVVSIRETSIMKEQSILMIDHQKTSVWPYVTGGQSLSLGKKGVVRFRLKNKGIGPAIVRQMSFSIGSQKVDNYNDIDKVLEQTLPKEAAYTLSTGDFGTFNEQVLRPDEQVDLIVIEFNRFPNDYSILSELAIKYDICYCSIYNDCWAINDYKTPVSCNTSD